MKKIIILLVLALTINISFSQDFSNLENIKLVVKEDYKPAEKQVLESAIYLFNTPYNKNSLNQANSIAFILRWMTGTPDYMFNLDDRSLKLTRGNSDLLGYYMAAMSKTVIESESKLSEDKIYTTAQEILLVYCYNDGNNMKPTKAMKKIMKGRKDK